MRQLYYLMVGLTFPGFWAFHAEGYWAALYLPLQKLFHTTATGWPSFCSALLLYGVVTVLFELFRRARDNARP